MNIAIVGSRQYPHLDDVRSLVAVIAADMPDAVIVSGGAIGVDTTAEQAALACGLRVVSYRPYTLAYDSHGVEEWVLGGQHSTSYVRQMVEHPTFAKYEDALFYRNILIVAKASRVVAFRAAWSPGTTFTMDITLAGEKPLKEYGVEDDKRLVTA